MLTKKKVLTGLALVIGIILLVNILADRFFIRLDFTADQEYTLSDATRNILNNLDAPVTIKAYFSQNLPPNIEEVRNDFRDILIEYNNLSDGKIVYDFINPNLDQQTEMDAQRAGIAPVMINVRERDQVKQQRAYLGAVLEYQGKKEIIPYIQPGSAMEYDLSSNIKKMTLKQRTKVGLLAGNGEPALSALRQLNEQLSILYDVVQVKLNDTTSIPNGVKTLVIIAPKDTIPEDTFTKLDSFLKDGGRILIAMNRVEGDFSTASGKSVYTGLSSWLNKKGIDVQDKFIVDVNSGNVMVRQQEGGFVMNTPVRFPYLPIITKFADHPITKGIESVIMPFASPIRISSKDSTLKVTPIALTSDKTGLESPPLYFNVSKQWTRADFGMSSLPVAVAVQGKFNDGNTITKMVIFGDGDFCVNGEGNQAQKLADDNVNLVSNAIDWLSDDTGLITLRTKGVTSRPIKADLEDSTKTFLKYFNFLLPIILIIGYGIFRYQMRTKKKNKWMSEDYV
jgi:gliding motility-associatede transport system auxiliary component